MSDFFTEYNKHVEERAALGIPPLPLTLAQATSVIALLQDIPKGKDDELLDLITNRVNPGVDPAAQVKAEFLFQIVKGNKECALSCLFPTLSELVVILIRAFQWGFHSQPGQGWLPSVQH